AGTRLEKPGHSLLPYKSAPYRILTEGCGSQTTRTRVRVSKSSEHNKQTKLIGTMIYDVNSPLFRSFLSQKGGSSDKRKLEEQKPKEHRPKASENKPIAIN
ncbi:wound-responsive protein-related protein, partial [Prunus dulcis]